jgi:PII-like signaling protein
LKLKRLRMMDIAGATVYRGILGYGVKGHTHKQSLMHFSHDLPVMISIVDSPEKLKRPGGPFQPTIRGYAKANGIPVVDCSVGERKHDIAEEYLAKTKVARGLFLILVGRAQAPV